MIKYISIAIVITMLTSCGNKQTEEAVTESTVNENLVELTDAQLKNAEIQTEKIYQRAIASLLKANGTLEVPPQNLISVSAPMGGYLMSTKLLEGMHISKGELIAVMEDQQYIQLQQDFLTAKAHFSSIEAEYKRQKDLNESKASSDKVFQQAQASYLSQKVLIKSLEEKLRLIGINPATLNEDNISRSIKIYAPIDGFVSKVNMHVGKYATPTDVLFELINPADVYLKLTVFEKELHKISVGQKLIAYSNAQPDKKYGCNVYLIGKDVSPEGFVRVHCRFEKNDISLIPGMFMNAEIEVLSDSAWAIPTEAVVGFEGKQFVFIQTDNKKYELQEVVALSSEKGFTHITFTDSAVWSNQAFVTKGAYALLMKMKNAEEE